MTTATRIRRKAASLIKKRGWVQVVGNGPDGQVCAVVALLDAAVALQVGLNHAWLAKHQIEDELGVLYLSHWNDETGRNQDEVIAALRGQQS